MKRARTEPCDFCAGELKRCTVEVTRGHGRKMVIIQEVPALVCNRCGERYYDATVVRSIEKLLKSRRSFAQTVRVPVARFEFVA